MLIFLIVISAVLINSALGNVDHPKTAVDKSTNEAPTDENNDQQQDNASGSGKLMKGMVWLLAASSGFNGANAVGDNGVVQVNPTIPPANAPLPPSHSFNLSDLKPHTQVMPNVPRKIGNNANNNGKLRKMTNFFCPPVLICVLSVLTVVVSSLNVLQIAPNFLDTNFELSVRFANLLGQSGHHVHFLVPLSKPSNLPALEQFNSNVHVQICHLSQKTLDLVEQTPEDKDYINPAPESIQKGGWTARHYKQSPAIAFVEGFEVIADIFRQKSCWNQLEEAHQQKTKFDVGLMDVWDFGALALFHKIGIKNVVLTHNFPIMSHMYKYMEEAGWQTQNGEVFDYQKQILDKGVPELFSAVINDQNVGKAGAYKEKHNESSKIFSTVYGIADQKFKDLFKDNAFPTLKNLFGDAKALFVNTMPSLDYDIGSLPKRVQFIGGIDLMQPDHKDALPQVFGQQKPVIVFSMSSLLEPSKMPLDKFKTVIQGLGMCKEKEVIWKYAKHEDHGRKSFLQKHAPNVHLVEDYDQATVIGNEKTELVISECDIRIVMDALSSKKALLCLPMFAEQFYVSEKLRRMGAAVVLDPRSDSFTPEGIFKSIGEALTKRHAVAFPSNESLKQTILNAFKELE